MIKPKQNNRLGILLSSAVIGATLCSSTAALARALEEHEWARPLLVPIHVRQELVTAQYVDECPTTCSNVGVSMEQQYVRMTPIHWQAREQQEDSKPNPNRHRPRTCRRHQILSRTRTFQVQQCHHLTCQRQHSPDSHRPCRNLGTAFSAATAAHAGASRATTVKSPPGPQSGNPWRTGAAPNTSLTAIRTGTNGVQDSLRVRDRKRSTN